MIYIFIVYLFDILDVDTFFYKFGQSLKGLTYEKASTFYI